MPIPKLFGSRRRVAANNERTANPEKVQEEDETTLHQSDRARKTRSRYTPTTAAQPSLRVSLRERCWFRVGEWLFGSSIVMIGLLAGVYQLTGGPPWPSDPEIHFRDTSDGSSLILPFTIRDRSGLVDMPDVIFRCGVDLVIAQDAKGQRVVIKDVAFLSGVTSLFVGKEPIPYHCNAADVLRIRPDGSLSVYGSSTILKSSGPQIYEPPWTIIKMCVWVGGEYKVAHILPWSFTSTIFQWPAMPGSH